MSINSNFMRFSGAGTLLMILTACAPNLVSQSVTVKAGNPAEVRTVFSAYLPSFGVGQKWVYRSQNETSDQEVSYEVLTVSPTEVVQKVSVRSTAGQEIGSEQVSLNRYGAPLNPGKTSLSQSLTFGGGFAGPQTSVSQSVNIDGSANNVEVHQSASSGGTTVSQDIAPLRYATSGQEDVTVPAGTYKADVFKAYSEQTYPRMRYTLWLVKNIGEVKSSQQLESSATASGTASTRELKSFTSAP